jgi:mannose-6-phosphate isomerase-like protein (cupin superfamily)
MSGTERRRLFERDGRWADWIRNDAGDASGWHHHAANDTYVFVLRGSVTIDYGPGGAESIVAGAGDFFIVPCGTIHRETTGQDVDLEAFVIRVGGEPEHVNVDGPDAAEV